MACFSERLNELLTISDIKAEALAKELNVSVQTIYDWKAGRQQINLINLLNLCDILNCSLDFIAGRSEVEINFKPQIPPKFNMAVRSMMKQKGVSTYKMRNETRFDGSYFARWDKGSIPFLSTLVELADYFDCTIDQLIGRENI